MIGGLERTITEGIVVLRSVVVVVGRCPGGLNNLRETVLGVIRLVTTVVVTRVAVVPSVGMRGTRRSSGWARRSLGCVLHDDALLFHECDELIDVIVCIVELHNG